MEPKLDSAYTHVDSSFGTMEDQFIIAKVITARLSDIKLDTWEEKFYISREKCRIKNRIVEKKILQLLYSKDQVIVKFITIQIGNQNMSNSNYYIFNDMLQDVDLGFKQSQIWKLPSTDVSWISGARHSKTIPVPIEVELNPKFGTKLLDSYHEYIPIWSDHLIHVLQNYGANNLDVYEAIINDSRTGLKIADYKAVNVIGRLDCVDMQRSEYDERSERGAREFRKLMVDPKKTMGLKIFRLDERPTVLVIDEDIKRGIEVAQLKGIRADRIELSR
ncbi:imm11 family protein [Leptospira santarosai]|uniref:imm11 family protein n=1 Tax=Leptospira santarosai TaxID=28183 RepID=UPI0002D4C060|nr:DUF1629 domain-containing protein [Leptospira santarosai]